MKNTDHIKQFIKANKNKSGVYAIICTKTWRSYVGSSVNIGGRITGHLSQLKNNKHCNPDLQSDFAKYGIDTFYVETLAYCSRDQLLEREEYWSIRGCNLYSSEKYTIKIPVLTQSQIDKFESLIDKNQECWIWKGSYRNEGLYGRIYFNKTDYAAHRISFFLATNIDPKDKIVCHKCDNKSCVNPDHLFLGSHSDNHLDRCSKGIGNINLTWNDVELIRKTGLDNKELYAKDILSIIETKTGINLNKQSLFSILLNKTWKDPNWKPLKSKRLSGEDCPWTGLTWDIVSELREKYQTKNFTLVQLSDWLYDTHRVKIGFKTVHKIVKNQRWKCLTKN